MRCGPLMGPEVRGVVRARGSPLRGLPWRSLGPGLGSACGSFEVMAFGRVEAIGALVVVRRWWLTTGPVRPAGRGVNDPSHRRRWTALSGVAVMSTVGHRVMRRGSRAGSLHRGSQRLKARRDEVRPGAQGIQREPGPVDPAHPKTEALRAEDVEGVGGDEEDVRRLQIHLLGRLRVDLGRGLVYLQRICSY